MNTTTIREKKFYNVTCRPYFRIPGLYVGENGWSIYRYYKNDIGSILPERPPKRMRIQTDRNGNSYIGTRDHGKLRVDELVLKCFKGEPQYWGRPFHIDGNPANCHKNNLKWISMSEYNAIYHADEDWKELFGEEDDVWVNVATGEVKQYGKILTIQNRLYDPDTDQMFSINNSVTVTLKNRYENYESRRFHVAELIASVKKQ